MRLLTSLFSVILILSSMLLGRAFGEPVDKDKQQEEKVEIAPADQNKPNKSAPKQEKVERFVMPFTKWVEGKLHNSPVINPTKDTAQRSNRSDNAGQMRRAIRRALKAYPGTVLSVDKSNQGSVWIYKVKIISKTGVVKIVTIQMDENQGAKEN